MALPKTMHGPGILWVASRISQSSKGVLDVETYMHWYEEDHIAEILSTSGIASAFRYIDVAKESEFGSLAAPKPFLAFYPMDDMSFLLSREFEAIKVRSDILPGSGIIYDLADLDVSYFGLMGRSGGEEKIEPAKYMVTSAIEPADGTPDDQVISFYDQQTATISKAPNYLRTLYWKLIYARANSQSRALKGLPTTEQPSPVLPTWQATHEFSAEPSSDVRQSIEKDPSRVLQNAKQNELHVYELAKAFGEGKFF